MHVCYAIRIIETLHAQEKELLSVKKLYCDRLEDKNIFCVY